MIEQHRCCLNHLKILIFFLFIQIIVVSPSPPGTSKQKRSNLNIINDVECVNPKRLRISNLTKNEPNTDYIIQLDDSNEEPESDRDNYSDVIDEVNELLKKFDFLSMIFYTVDEKVYLQRQKHFIEEIRTKLVDLIDFSCVEYKPSFSYFLGRAVSNTIYEFRNEMIQAISFIKLQMFEQVSNFCTQISNLLDEIKIYSIVNAQFDSESSYGTEGSITPKNLDDLESLDGYYLNPDDIKAEPISLSDYHTDYLEDAVKDELIIPNSPGPITYITEEELFNYTTKSDIDSDTHSTDINFDLEEQDPSSTVLVLKKSDTSSKAGSSKDSESWEVITKVKSQNKKFDLSALSLNSVYDEEFTRENIIKTQNFYLGKDKDQNEIGFNDIKTFLSHIHDGFIPQFGKFTSQLAQALTASVIIMQETGMVDYLIDEYKLKFTRSKFVVDMLFEQKAKREEYEHDEHVADYLDLNTFYEFKRFKELNKKVHPHVTQGEEWVRTAAIDFAIKLFPKLSIDFGQAGHQATADPESLNNYTALEQVLMSRKLTVLVHPKDFDVFVNFSSRKMKCYHHRFLSLAVRILERHYLHSRKQKIKIEYKKTVDPLKDLMEKRGHMTGLYFIMEEVSPSSTFFGYSVETLRVPVVAYGSCIIIHKKYGVSDLESWQEFVKHPPDGKKTIVTNFKTKFLASYTGSYKIIPIILANHNDAPYLRMLEFNPTAGLFWGVDNRKFAYHDFNVIDFPYCTLQGPYFLRDA